METLKKNCQLLSLLSLFLILTLLFYINKNAIWTTIFACLSMILVILFVFTILISRNPSDRIFYFTIFLFITTPLAVYTLILIIGFYSESLLVAGDVGDWIAFSGSIIGGAMTMFALIFTINHENDKASKQQELTLLPYIECVGINNSLVSVFKTGIDIEIKNLSSNPARNIHIDVTKSSVICDDTYKQLHFTASKPLIIDYLAPNQVKTLSIAIDLTKKKNNKYS